MSWYSDKEKYNEIPDSPYCKNCKRTDATKVICDRCVRMHEEDEVEEDDG